MRTINSRFDLIMYLYSSIDCYHSYAAEERVPNFGEVQQTAANIKHYRTLVVPITLKFHITS